MKGESEMKRSFQVATLFTGAVACATVLAPMADAATTTVTPDTTAKNCAVSNSSVHLIYSKKADHPVDACITGAGYVSFTGGKKFAGICGGGWSGSFYYSVPGTKIAGTSVFNQGYLPVMWKQTDRIYYVHLINYDYGGGFQNCVE